ncbi:MAG: FAD-binding oxidoreductase [Caulobacteraceae bacterium]|nr:FAD-binding oxidoreductase [Caulobacteraceae bacterium]
MIADDVAGSAAPAGTAVDWEQVARDLAPIPSERGTARVRRMSRDYHWYSPVLRERLKDVIADLVVSPRTEAELAMVVRYCARRRLAITPRGGGTGNYGQSMPVEGGVLVDCTGLDQILWLRDGVVRAGAGALLRSIEAETVKSGWELRFHPSTWKMATIGGFVGGGTTGCGAINYGTLHDAGNLLGLRLMTMEEEPRFIELRGADLEKAIHAYGATGIITEVEIALAPHQDWREFVVSFPTLRQALEASWAVAHADGVAKKELAVIDWGAAQYFDDLLDRLRPDQPIIMASVAASSREAFLRLTAQAGGEVVFDRSATPESDIPPLYEFCWNHTTLQALKHDRDLTYLQVQFPAENPVEMVLRMDAQFGSEVVTHVEVLKAQGRIRYSALQLVRYTGEQRLTEIIAHYRASGCPVRDPHTFTLERGPQYSVNPRQAAFKIETDPFGLLNPGKMPGWSPPNSAA